ncbi:hypothetical protein EUX98_g5856 [Antrodiella citrinella]|uniref:Uncharacterized protein n=1 Tax=Antrodiella citrinella TaxID=2447956 RepID=A0A4S4MQR1_9APHY|nr:hypothetical protein EUX98_g5856 [Antrodiella citrinella]
MAATLSSNGSVIDNTDGQVLYYQGNWSQFTVFDAASASVITLSYTANAGAALSLAFPPDSSASTRHSAGDRVWLYQRLLPSSTTATYRIDSDGPIQVTFPPLSSAPPSPGSQVFFISQQFSSNEQYLLRIQVVDPPFVLDKFALVSASPSDVPSTPDATSFTPPTPTPSSSGPARHGGGGHAGRYHTLGDSSPDIEEEGIRPDPYMLKPELPLPQLFGSTDTGTSTGASMTPDSHVISLGADPFAEPVLGHAFNNERRLTADSLSSEKILAGTSQRHFSRAPVVPERTPAAGGDDAQSIASSPSTAPPAYESAEGP